MKIKEVCRRTGLTERTIRYYEEQGLFTPGRSAQNGRISHNYSEEDLNALRAAAILRKSGFTIAEIKRMKRCPEEIPKLVQDCIARLHLRGEEELRNMEALSSLGAADLKGAESLAVALENRTRSLPLPQTDLALNFGRFDPETDAEKREEIRAYQKREEHRRRNGKRVVYTIGISSAALAFFNLILNVLLSNSAYGIAMFVLTSVFAAALMCGVKWVYWCYIASSALSVLQSFFSLLRPEFDAALFLSSLTGLAINLAVVLILLKSRSVKAFFEEKRG